MNYETLIWLEPVAHQLRNVLVAALFISSIICVGAAIFLAIEATDSFIKENTRKVIRLWVKRSFLIVIILVIPMISLSPFANFTDIYKKLLIYRGINSTLADRTVDTADKALDLLNAKIDKEMKLLDPEQENK
jgi:hypothetical protein